MLDIRRITCGAYAENAYLINGEILIDPGDDINALRAAAPGVKAILLTHGHFDHALSAYPLQIATGAKVYVEENDVKMLTDAALSCYDENAAEQKMPESIDCETYANDALGFTVIRTPGHTPGSVCLYNAEAGVLFSGDTLFRAGFGRVDLPGGRMSDMLSSLRILFALPRETRVYPGHGEATTIGEECGRYGK